MAGATAPATLAGTVAVQNAESLAGIVLANVSIPAYSASGSMLICAPAVLPLALRRCTDVFDQRQLAKFYNLPCRISGNISDSKCVDTQAGYESMMNLITAQIAGDNYILHACGILEHIILSPLKKS